MKRLLRAALLVLAFLLTQALIWVVCTAAAYGVGVWRSTTEVHSADLATLPVLIVFKEPGSGQSTAAVVWHPDAASFLAAHSGATFVVTPEDEGRLREHISRNAVPGGVRGTFRVTRRTDGTQSFRVDAFEGGDIFTTSWYDARRDSVVPLRHRRYFGPGLGLASVLIAVPLSVIVNIAAWLGVSRWRRSRQAPG